MNTMTLNNPKLASYATVLLRLGLGVGFLSAVADRLGLWGAFGQPNVEWGNFSRFLEYTHTLNWYLPAAMILLLGILATGAEIVFGDQRGPCDCAADAGMAAQHDRHQTTRPATAESTQRSRLASVGRLHSHRAMPSCCFWPCSSCT